MKDSPAPATDARRFLDAFAAATPDGDPLRIIGDDPEGFSAAIATQPEALADVLAADNRAGPVGPVRLNGGAFASAACNLDGHLIARDAAFAAWIGAQVDASAVLDRFTAERPSITFLVEDRGKCVAVVAAPLATARNWPLAPHVRACLESGDAAIAVLARFEPDHDADSKTTFARAFGLTSLEARTCAALVQAGSARAAAQLAGISYETARSVLKIAMQKGGVANQSALVRLIMQLNTGEIPLPRTANVIADVFGLTARQARVALALAAGHNRAGAATVTGLSSHIVKTELAAIYEQLGVGSLASLCRAICEIEALSALAEACSVELNAVDGRNEPLRLLQRTGRAGRIAFADHGPPEGRPTLIIQTSMNGRHLPAAHVAALQGLGLRPISIDRPGTGLTDPVEGALLAETARDMVDVLDVLMIDRACVVARGGATVLASFARHHGARLDRAVALNPEPGRADDTLFSTFAGYGKRLIYQQPALIGLLAGHLSRRASNGTLAALLRKALADSPADSKTLADDVFMADFVRAMQQSALQNGAGFISIARTHVDDAAISIPDGAHISILSGTQDPLFRLRDGLARWQAIWPGCTIEAVPDAGRLLQFQRPDLIAKFLVQGPK
jgi:pimeloyl-ACP methyl ester carboxylesterase/DNA-binding CsgD family transcriptional regulator